MVAYRTADPAGQRGGNKRRMTREIVNGGRHCFLIRASKQRSAQRLARMSSWPLPSRSGSFATRSIPFIARLIGLIGGLHFLRRIDGYFPALDFDAIDGNARHFCTDECTLDVA
jgi:hypothetical protein